MQCDRAEPGLRAPSVDVENKAAALSPWVRTTLPVCHELPTLPVLAVKAAWVEPQVTARLMTRPTGTATGSTVRRARGARWCTATPRRRCDAAVCVLDVSGIGAAVGPLRSPGGVPHPIGWPTRPSAPSRDRLGQPGCGPWGRVAPKQERAGTPAPGSTGTRRRQWACQDAT